MKGCLKVRSRSSSPGQDNAAATSAAVATTAQHCPLSHRKCVAFGVKVSEEVHIADEWDRTPTEPTRKLSYQDLLELKEIQRSLPHADQPGDPLTGKPARHYLSGVPIGLLPLLADSSDDSSSTPSPRSSSPSPTEPSLPWNMNFHRSHPPPPRSSAIFKVPPHLAHLLPSRPAPDRLKKSGFAFLPLLDTPPSSGTNSPNLSNTPSRTPSPSPPHGHEDDLTDPPTPSLTNASLDSSPHSRASSCSPEPPLLQLPPLNAKSLVVGVNDSYFPPQDDILYTVPHYGLVKNTTTTTTTTLRPIPSPTLVPPSPLTLEVIAPKPRPAKKRNFIVVNDMEIELDDDEAEEEEEEKEKEEGSIPSDTTPTTTTSSIMDERTATPTVIEDTALSERVQTEPLDSGKMKKEGRDKDTTSSLDPQPQPHKQPPPPRIRTPTPSSSPSSLCASSAMRSSPTKRNMTPPTSSPPRRPVSPLSKPYGYGHHHHHQHYHHRHTHQYHSNHSHPFHEPRLHLHRASSSVSSSSSSSSSPMSSPTRVLSPPVTSSSSPSPVGVGVGVGTTPTALNESVNLHIPILFKRGMRTTSVGGRGDLLD